MTSTPVVAASKRPARRSQADRSAASRQRVLEAAIRVLHRGGYSAANVKAIAKEAGVSLGSLQHQFPTKARLMTAVVEQLAEKRIEAYRADAKNASDPLARYIGAFDTTWALVKEPEFAAVLEIMLARRSDPELREASEAAFQATETFMRTWVLSLGAAVHEDVGIASFSRSVSNTFMYGLAMRLAVGMDPSEAEDLAAYFKSLLTVARRHPDLLPPNVRPAPVDPGSSMT